MANEIRQMVDEFVDQHPIAYNVAHVVLDDHNMDDHSIRFCLDKWIPENRVEWGKTFRVSQSEIDEVTAFLTKLLTIPEDERDYYDD